MTNSLLKKLLAPACAGLLCLALSSCAYAEMRRNRRNLARIRLGMTKKKVLGIMGEPVKGEIYCSDRVWFYYTNQKWMDGLITRDECTPVAFDEFDRIRGWGPAFNTGVYDFSGASGRRKP